MGNIGENSKPSKGLVQEWMDGISFALEHVPAGHQIDLARQIIDTHYPYTPDLTFNADRGDIMLWAASQEVRHLIAVLDEIIIEIGVRRVPEIECKRLMKISWDRLDGEARQAFLKWAQREASNG